MFCILFLVFDFSEFMIAKKEVEHIAKLARLELTEKEKKKFQKQLGEILDFVKKLQKLKTKGIEPIAQITGLENIFREDVEKKEPEMKTKKLIDQAPMKEGNFVKTKGVFE